MFYYSSYYNFFLDKISQEKNTTIIYLKEKAIRINKKRRQTIILTLFL